MGDIVVHITDLAEDLLPKRGRPDRSWWNDDPLTMRHARHCLPLVMANTLGYVIRSPGQFKVEWDGSPDSPAVIEDVDGVIADNHSAAGTFTVQPGFVARTQDPGDLLMVRPVPNMRGCWFSAMEALIEAWWQPGEFGVVCMLHRAGRFTVTRGDPLAQMCVFRAEGGSAGLMVRRGAPPETERWRARRYRADYRKDLDYLQGRHPDGTEEPTHRRSWAAHGEGPGR